MCRAQSKKGTMEKPLIRIGNYLVNVNAITHVSVDTESITLYLAHRKKDGSQAKLAVSGQGNIDQVRGALSAFLLSVGDVPDDAVSLY